MAEPTEAVIKHFMVDADEVVDKIVELLRPIAKNVARDHKRAFMKGMAIAFIIDYGSIKVVRAFKRGWDAESKKQKNDGFTTH